MNLTLSWRRPLSYRNQSIDLLPKSMDWFLYDNGLHHERANLFEKRWQILALLVFQLSFRIARFYFILNTIAIIHIVKPERPCINFCV